MYRRTLSTAVLSSLSFLAAAPAAAAIPPDFPRVVVFATNSVWLEQGSEVISGDVIVNAASPGPTLSSQQELTVGLGVHTPAGYALKADGIKVKQSAVVGGEAFCNELDDGSGSVTCAPLSLPVFATLPEFSTGPADGPDVSVAQDAMQDLDAGTYGLLDVRSGGIVRFTGGTYDLREIDTGPSVTLVFLAPSTIHVADKLHVEQGSFVGPDPATSLAASDVVFYVAGINGASGALGATPKAAHLGINSTVRANFYVPNGTLWLRQGTAATGAFLARDVDVGVGVSVALDTAFSQTTVADPQAVATFLDTPVVITLTGSAEADNLPLTFSIVADPTHGTVTKPPTTESPTSARTTYVPEEGFTGVDSFTFQVEDAVGTTATAVVTVTVSDESGSSDVVAFDLSLVTDQETPIDVTLRGSTTLEETVQIAIATSPAHGTLGPLTPVAGDPNAQLVTYTPAAGFTGTDGFTFEACVSTGCDTGTVTLSVRPVSIQVSILKQGAGSGRVSSLPEGIDCGLVCSAGFSSESTISLFAVADPGSIFTGWSGDADCADGQLTPDGDKTCIADFALETPPAGDVLVSVSTAGAGNGRVVSDPEGIDCGSVCQALFPARQRVFLAAIADPGSQFVGWSGSGDCLDGELEGSTDVSCVATFDLLPTATSTLTVVLDGPGAGVVSSSPAGINCPGACEADFESGTAVRLVARADDGSVFAAWSGDCVADADFPFVARVTVDADKTCTATFTQ